MIERFFKRMVPLALMGMGASISGCDGTNISFGDSEGVPLAELDLTGPAPTELALGSGDTVILSQGDTLAITIEGDDAARDDLRFVRDGAMLGIGRASGLGTNKTSPATIRVTMAAPTELMIGGRGAIAAQSLASTAELAIGGSGSISFASVDAERLEIAIGGSGKVTGAGTAKRMEINIGGRGDVDLAGLNAERVEITIGGSGDVAFASDGTVGATIAGSGDIAVTGRAKCTTKSFGSGKLTCTPGNS
jgi:hypothetical protein